MQDTMQEICDECKKPLKNRRAKAGHMKFAHNINLNKVNNTTSSTDAVSEEKPNENNNPDLITASVSDFIKSLSIEEWEEIGRHLGYLKDSAEGPAPVPAAVADQIPETTVFLATYGVLIRFNQN